MKPDEQPGIPDYSRNFVLKLQVDCMKTQGEIALRYLDIENRQSRKNQTKLNMFGHSPNLTKLAFLSETQLHRSSEAFKLIHIPALRY